MDDDNAQKRAHQVVFIKEDADRGIDAQLRECVGQQKRQHERLPSRILEPGDGVRRRNADEHGGDHGDERDQEGLADRRYQVFLRKHKPPVFESPRLREYRRGVIFVRKRQHEHVHHRPVEKQKKRRQNDELPESPLSHRMVKPSRVQHLKHRTPPLLFLLQNATQNSMELSFPLPRLHQIHVLFR